MEDKKQICKTCGNELDIGYLAGGGIGLAFYPGEENVNIWGIKSSFRMLGKFFTGKSIFKFLGTEAYQCKKSKKNDASLGIGKK